MHVASLGYRTDLILRALEGSEVTESADRIVVRSPANPRFRWGNFVLFREPPRPGDSGRWPAVFSRDVPGTDYVALGIDITARPGQAVGEFLASGFDCQVNTVLTAADVQLPPYPNRDARYRPLAGEQDWDQSVRLTLACHPGGADDQAFLRRRTAAKRRLAEGGRGAWFGAFLGQRLVAHLGVWRTQEGTARFQDVETHPDARRQGLAGTLVYHAASYARTSQAARTLVIVADPDGSAIRLYRSLGFQEREQQVSLERLRRP